MSYIMSQRLTHVIALLLLLLSLSAKTADADELSESIEIFQSYIFRAEQAATEAARSTTLAQEALRAGREADAVRLFTEADRALEEAARNRGLAQQALQAIARVNPSAARGLQVAMSNVRYLLERVAWGLSTVIQGIARATGIGSVMRSFLSSYVGRGLSAVLGVASAALLPLTIADAVLGMGAGTAYAAEPGPCSESLQDCVDRLTCELLTSAPRQLAELSASCQIDRARSTYYSLLNRTLERISQVRTEELASTVQCQAALDSVYASVRGSAAEHLISCGVQGPGGNSCLLMASREACHACCNGDTNSSDACWGDCDVWFDYDRCYQAAAGAVSFSKDLCPVENTFLIDNYIPGLSPQPVLPSTNNQPRPACELQVELLFGAGPYSPEDARRFSSCVDICVESIPQECALMKEAKPKAPSVLDVPQFPIISSGAISIPTGGVQDGGGGISDW